MIVSRLRKASLRAPNRSIAWPPGIWTAVWVTKSDVVNRPTTVSDTPYVPASDVAIAPRFATLLPTAKPTMIPAAIARRRRGVARRRFPRACRSLCRSLPRAGRAPAARCRPAGTRRAARGTRRVFRRRSACRRPRRRRAPRPPRRRRCADRGPSASSSSAGRPVSCAMFGNSREVDSDEPARAILARPRVLVGRGDEHHPDLDVVRLPSGRRSPALAIRAACPLDVGGRQAAVEQDAVGDAAGELERPRAGDAQVERAPASPPRRPTPPRAGPRCGRPRAGSSRRA